MAFALICSARFRRSCSIVVTDVQHAGYLFLERNWSVASTIEAVANARHFECKCQCMYHTYALYYFLYQLVACQLMDSHVHHSNSASNKML